MKPPPSPLTELLAGAGLVDEDVGDLARTAELRALAFDEVEACMQAEGFRWHRPDDRYFQPDFAVEGTPAWIEDHGFGVTTLRFTRSQVGPDLLARPDVDRQPDANEPNVEYEASLSPEELDAYRYALHGVVLGDPDPPDSSSPDCLDRNWHKYVRADSDKLEAFHAHFAAELDGIAAKVEADARMLAFTERLQGCMSEAGFADFADLDHALARLVADVSELDPALSTSDSLASMTNAEIDRLSDEELQELLDDEPPALSAQQRSRLATLQATELELGRAWLECGGTPGHENLRRYLQAEYEREFLDEHEGAVLAYLEARMAE